MYIYICIIMHLRMGSYVYIYRIFAICEWNTYDIWYIEKNRRHAPTASASSCWAESSSPGKKKKLILFGPSHLSHVAAKGSWFLQYVEALLWRSDWKLRKLKKGFPRISILEARQEDYLQLRCQKPATKLCSNTDLQNICIFFKMVMPLCLFQKYNRERLSKTC